MTIQPLTFLNDSSLANLQSWEAHTRLTLDSVEDVWAGLEPYFKYTGEELVWRFGWRYNGKFDERYFVSLVGPFNHDDIPLKLRIPSHIIHVLHRHSTNIDANASKLDHIIIPNDNLPPILDVVSLIQCVVPGLITVGNPHNPDIQRGLPELSCMTKNQRMLKDVMGWEWVCRLIQAGEDVGRAVMRG